MLVKAENPPSVTPPATQLAGAETTSTAFPRLEYICDPRKPSASGGILSEAPRSTSWPGLAAAPPEY